MFVLNTHHTSYLIQFFLLHILRGNAVSLISKCSESLKENDNGFKVLSRRVRLNRLENDLNKRKTKKGMVLSIWL